MKKTLGTCLLLGAIMFSTSHARNVTTWDQKFYIHINDKQYVYPKSSGKNYTWSSTGNISITSQRNWECQIQASSRIGDATLKVYDPYNNGLCESIDVQVVELKFKEKSDQFYGFYEYKSAPTGSHKYFKSVKLNDMDTVTAWFDKPIVDDKFRIYLSSDSGLSAGNSISKNDETVLIQSKSGTGIKSVYYKGSFSGTPTLGSLRVHVYKERPMNIRVIPIKLNGDSRAPDPSRFNVGDYVRKTFNQVCFNTSFTIESPMTIDMSLSEIATHLQLTKLENKISRNSNDICILLVNNITSVRGVGSPLGFVRELGSKYAYLVTEATPGSGMSWENTTAHEIGHSLGLPHVSANDSDNLMKSSGSTKNKLNKDQWEQIGQR